MPLRLNDCKRAFIALRRERGGINKFYFLSYRQINQNGVKIILVLLSRIIKIGGGIIKYIKKVEVLSFSCGEKDELFLLLHHIDVVQGVALRIGY